MKKLIWLLLLVTASMWAQTTNYNPGTTATILSAVTTTGTGTCYAMLNQGAIPANFTWQTVISGGTASSIAVVFEGSLNSDCSNPSTIDTSTSTSGETRSVANKAYPYITANITAYSRNGTTATVNFVAQYGSGVPTPSAANLCFVSQGAFQGSWTWKACSGAGGTVSSITTTSPITGGPITSTGAIGFDSSATLSNNTSGTAAGLSGTSALPNGTTATTQAALDNSTNVSTTAYADALRTATASLTNKSLVSASSGNTVIMALPFQGAAAPLTGNSADQTVYSVSLPGNTLRAGTGVRVHIWMTHSTGSASVGYKVSFGGASILFSSTTSSAGPIEIVILIRNDPGSTSAQHFYVEKCVVNGAAFGGTAVATTSKRYHRQSDHRQHL